MIEERTIVSDSGNKVLEGSGLVKEFIQGGV
ncbi:MAG: hypothetical protein QOG17_3492, partial [Gammaproteobacteria bacterium]|nr:hypothetical protein [Gammaproteobacteria bacterium]